MNRVLVISQWEIKEQMAGPAIRCWEISRVLASQVPVTLATPNKIPAGLQAKTTATCQQYDPQTILTLASSHDILFIQGFLLEQYPGLQKLEKILIADLYDPFPLESLENPQETELTLQWQRHLKNITTLNRQIILADYMICASEKQKDYWLGCLTALNRINPSSYQQGNFNHLLGVVPFGISEQTIETGTKRLRGLGAGYGIEENDFVLLWGGGIWDWLDPLTPIRAIAELAKKGIPVKLFFLGVTLPETNLPQMQMGHKAISLAKELGIYEKHVIFNKEWIPYEERQYFLNEADVGINCHFDHLETRFAFRTRALDYFWAQLPVITTCGDTVADWIERYDAGIVTGFESVEDWIEAIQNLQIPSVYEKKQKGGQQLQESLKWSTIAQPLIEFCKQPVAAVDRTNRKKIQQACLLSYFPLVERIYDKWEQLGTVRLLQKVFLRFLKIMVPQKK